jgi:hypothetical protein
LTITIPPASLLTDFDQLDIAEAIRNAVAHDATILTAHDRRALTLLTYVPGLHGGTRALAHVLAEDRVALPLPTDLAMALLDVIGDDDLLGPEPEWPVQEAWLAARKPTSTTGEVMTLMATQATYHLCERDSLDGSGTALPFLRVEREMPLPEVLHVASMLGRSIDVMADDTYVVSYCGASPYWWLPGTHGGGMHQISSRGWCHDCDGYVHHLAREIEVAVLTCEARYDHVFRQRLEKRGQTPEEYAEEMAGNAVPLER